MRRVAPYSLGLLLILGPGYSLGQSPAPAPRTTFPVPPRTSFGLWTRPLMYHGDTLRVLDGEWGEKPGRTYVEVRKNSTRYRFPVRLTEAVSPVLDQWLARKGPEPGWHAGYDYVDEGTGTLWLSIRTGSQGQFGWVRIDLKSATVLSGRLERARYSYADDSARIYDVQTNDVLLDLREQPELQGLKIRMFSGSPDNTLWAALLASNDSSEVIWWSKGLGAFRRLPLPATADARMVDWSPDGSWLSAGYLSDSGEGVSVFRRAGDTLISLPMAAMVVEGPWRFARPGDLDRPLPPMWLGSGKSLGLRVSRPYLWDNRKGERYFPWGEGDSVMVFELHPDSVANLSH